MPDDPSIKQSRMPNPWHPPESLSRHAALPELQNSKIASTIVRGNVLGADGSVNHRTGSPGVLNDPNWSSPPGIAAVRKRCAAIWAEHKNPTCGSYSVHGDLLAG